MTRRSRDPQAAFVAPWHQFGLLALAFAKRHGFTPANLARRAARLPALTSAALTFVRLETAHPFTLVNGYLKLPSMHDGMQLPGVVPPWAMPTKCSK